MLPMLSSCLVKFKRSISVFDFYEHLVISYFLWGQL